MRFNLLGYKVEITRNKEKRRGYSRRSWTKSETDTMLRLRNEGKSWEEISKLLNRTASAITARHYKIKNKHPIEIDRNGE